MKMRPYSFTVLRYVHDIMTSEFVNVGIILYVPSLGSVQERTSLSIGRIRCVFPNLDRKVYSDSIKAVRRAIGQVGTLTLSESADARSIACMAVPADDSSFQWSESGAGLTDNPGKTLGDLYSRLVKYYDNKIPAKRSDEDVWRLVRDKLTAKNVHLKLQEKVFSGANDQIEFKHAWKNGVWHAYEPISLDLADADNIKDKARRWRGHLAAVADGASEALKLHLIIGAPENPALKNAYERALAILRHASLSPQVYEEDQIDILVAQIEDEVRAHEQSGAERI
jgi:hypothetical protein